MESAMIQTPWEEVMDRGEGSLTSSAEKIFAANINVKVINTESAILDMDFLLVSITMVFGITLALVRIIVEESDLQCDVAEGRHAAVNAVGRGGEGVRGLGRDWLRRQIGRGENTLRRTLGSVRTIGRHIGCGIEGVAGDGVGSWVGFEGGQRKVSCLSGAWGESEERVCL